MMYFFGILLFLFSFKINGEDYQLSLIKGDTNPQLSMFLQPVFSRGISNYLKDTFNVPAYAQEFLPNNFFHFIELLQHAHDTGKPKLYVKSVFRLFNNKLKASTYINAYAFHDLLAQFPLLLKDHLVVSTERAFDSVKDIINEMLLSSLVSKFPDFKANPGTFLDALSQDIEDAVELRKLLMIFLEISLNKLVWSPQEKEQTWENVKKIAGHIDTLRKNHMIVDQDDVNSLYITLLERYCFFLDVANTALPASMYQKIKEDITNNKIDFLELEEQEKYLETKTNRLLRALFEGESRALAREKGLII